MFRLRARRGQASAISVAILAAATLALAIGLYAYFTGHAARAGAQSALLDKLAAYTDNIDVYVNVYTSNSTGNVYLYCYSVTVTNAAGADLRIYYTVLPVARVDAQTVAISRAIERVPLDETVTPPSQTVFSYLLSDYDQDGIVEIVGENAAGNLVAVGGDPTMPSCIDIFNNDTIKALDFPYTPVPADSVYLVVGGPSLQEEAQLQVNVTTALQVPLWERLVPSMGKVDLYIYVESPVRLDKLSFVVLVPFQGEYYAAIIAELPVTG